jgi:hypothetical protein
MPGGRKLVTIISPSRKGDAAHLTPIGVTEVSGIVAIAPGFPKRQGKRRGVPFRANGVLDREAVDSGR